MRYLCSTLLLTRPLSWAGTSISRVTSPSQQSEQLCAWRCSSIQRTKRMARARTTDKTCLPILFDGESIRLPSNRWVLPYPHLACTQGEEGTAVGEVTGQAD